MCPLACPQAHTAQVGFSFRRIEMALNYIVDHLPALSGLAAETERLDALFEGVLRGHGLQCDAVLGLQWQMECILTIRQLCPTSGP